MSGAKDFPDIPAWQDRAGRALMAASSLAALWAFAGGLTAIEGSTPDKMWLETWRTAGFFVFAGLFAVLAWRPRLSAGIWELAFADKAALAALGFAYGSTEGAQAAAVDAVLALLLAAAYLGTRGWRSWRKPGAV
jgi:hypothetical protein